LVKALSLLLCLLLTLSVLTPALPAFAASIQKDFTVSETVKVDGTNKTTTAKITYDWDDGTTTDIPVESVTVSPDMASLTVGDTEQLTATVAPANATDKNVTWTSSNTSVATVDANGIVTAISAGAADITVTTVNGGYTAKCIVAVQLAQSTPPVTNIVYAGGSTITGTGISGASITVTLPNSTTVNASVNSGGTWTVDVPSGVTLAGEQIISAVQQETGKAVSNTVSVAVRPRSEPPIVNPVYENDTTISGTGVAGDAILITSQYDVYTTFTYVDSGGTWTANVPEIMVLMVGNEIEVEQMETDKAISQMVSVPVLQAT